MHKRIPIVLGIFLVCIAVWLLLSSNSFISGLVERFELLGYDLQLRTRINTILKKEISPIVIVDIDDKTLQAEGRWPWERSKTGELINKIHQQGAAVIAIDIIFPEKETNIADLVSAKLIKKNLLNSSIKEILEKNKLDFDEDKIFAEQLTNSQAILPLLFSSQDQKTNTLPPPIFTLTTKESEDLEIFHANGYISNIPILQQATKYSGMINIFPDSDGIIRRAPLIAAYESGVYPSLSLQAIMLFLGEKITLFTPKYDNQIRLEGIQLGNRIIPTDVNGQALIPFIGKSFTFPYFSATDVLHDNIAKDALFRKIVFIGSSAVGMRDLVPTTVQNPYPGAEIHATLANGILKNIFSYEPGWTRGAELFLTVLFGLISAFIFPFLGPRILGLITILFPPSLLLINNFIWSKTGLLLSLIMPCITVLVIALLNIIYGYLFETRKREQLKKMFGQYVPAKHIDEMLKSPEDFALHGESRELSVLFADIRSFTSISEKMTATDLVTMLNNLFTPMTGIIFKYRGTIDKYVGDLIMAFWGAPLKDKNHAQHAIISALEMQKKLKQLREDALKNNGIEISMGMGINSGVMNVGDMGSQYRRNYTVLGDAVNLASRVESLSKYYGVYIIVTENTQAHQTKFVFRKLDIVRVKGKHEGVAIYEAICMQTELTDELKHELEEYHRALECYYEQRWDDALRMMTELYNKHPDTKIYHLYMDRINEFKHEPPSADWDGVYTHTSK